MINSLPLTLTLPMPAIDEVTLAHQGLNYLRPDVVLDFISVSPNALLFVTPVAVLFASLGVVGHVPLRRIPVAVSGRVTYPICTQVLPELRGKLIINTAARKLKFLENQVVKRDEFAPSTSQVIGLALEFTFQQPE
ncbi:dTDP-glucose pyrophosphorylase [Scandinavium sp. H11S7]|uniref:dTDP-glucose pyrophosphorylase n=1 Tax=Scandinavium hiltneri TaxID=2926519 RepID=UPI002165C6DE|nr:dTDP-glucose pyrophosphorylase [Scandinavium hiltneri]MCS2157920.1 dTDP-glucose pyrophosphorylase [Scandinavium hiltneri]